MEQSELRAKITRGDLSSVFVFCGEENYLKKHYLYEIRKKIVDDETFAPFNYIRFDGETIDFAALFDALASPPLMADFKLIEWRYPDVDTMKDNDIEQFEKLCEMQKEYPYCTVVFLVSDEDFDLGRLPKKPSKIYKALSSVSDVVVFNRADLHSLCVWITRHFASEGVTVSRECVNVICDRVGHSMEQLAYEIDKLVAYVKSDKRSEVTYDDIDKVTSGNYESDVFGLSDAILERDAQRAFSEIKEKKLGKSEPTLVLASVYHLFGDLLTVSSMMAEGLSKDEIAKKTGIHPYRVDIYMRSARKMGIDEIKHILDMCRDIDDTTKRSGADAYVGLERLVSRIVSNK